MLNEEYKLAIVVSPEYPEGTALLLEPNTNPTASKYQRELISTAKGMEITPQHKTDFGSSKSPLKQFSKKDCKNGDRKSMPTLWSKLCERLERDG